MLQANENDYMEAKIVEVAKQMFIENGFSQTSMSDIAARAGIKRPVLHYYFRTKEKMYRAVFSNIVSTLFPKIQDILLQHEKPIEERIGLVVDAYYAIFCEYPSLPLFVVREIRRDVDFLSATIRSLGLDTYIDGVRLSLLHEMDAGRLKRVPLLFVFYTFYGLMTIPFLTSGITETMILDEGDCFRNLLDKWKPYIVGQMKALLSME